MEYPEEYDEQQQANRQSSLEQPDLLTEEASQRQ